MASIIRHTAVWTGFVGAPGYSNFYHLVGGAPESAAQSGHDSVWALFDELKTLIPNDVNITVDPVWQEFDETNGEVFASGTVDDPSEVVDCSNANVYAGNSGASLDWTTDYFIDGRRLKGRTYLVPMAGIYNAAGGIDTTARNSIRGAGNWIVSASQTFVVWHRPVAGIGGVGRPITGVLVPATAVILRSRNR